MNSYIVVDDERADSAAAIVQNALEAYGPSKVICLSDFLATSGWEFDPNTGLLEQSDGSNEGTFLKDAIVCNRIIQVSKATLAKLDQGFGVINPRLTLAAYNRTLQRAALVLGDLNPFPAGHVLPLNLQWRTFCEHTDDVSTPRFLYGFGAEEIDTSTFREPIWKSIFDLYSWQSTGCGVRPELQKFVVDKPLGTPAMAYFVGEAHSVFPLHPQDELSISATTRLSNCAEILRHAFRWFMGEGLFYIDNDDIVFAAFSPSMKTSTSDSSFQGVVEKGISGAIEEAHRH